ncbi:transporter suffix domain-containing protein [Fictibacillus phosphorivorans]|uniref:transporter suffix domain-containing protein n=1 Tax=Fictibacillus phosphorivorans TaxID=1221500 RepID=UPI00203E8E3D|nr:transporter suffix domain-containing protein [Fictibacillus phosphorivorans]MCM3720034.1 transporter suffix domain-containing protein [Fictibacillus phosphorivorans]MCM3777696.1 transporter suffix domain-containing protein [Fictibacillus phosphorivorans]
MKKKIGIVMIILSFVLWVFIPIIPFLTLSAAIKTGIVSGLIIGGEVLFWLGALLAGKDIVKNFIQKFWRKKKNKEDDPS